MQSQEKTAAIIIIGDEILSGRTQDINVQFIASELSESGIRLKEVRVIPDIKPTIVKVVNELRYEVDYVFTTGGIGPTHDDITAESIAEAFGVKLFLHEESYELMEKRCRDRGIEINQGTKKMAYLPKGASPIKNEISAAPGFEIENVFVFAGIPNIMQSMFSNIKHKISTAEKFYSRSVVVKIGESSLAPVLTDLQSKYNMLSVGSYPKQSDSGDWSVTVVMRGKAKSIIESAKDELCKNIKAMRVEFYLEC